jgi:lysyl-tRNA synthetase class 2
MPRDLFRSSHVFPLQVLRRGDLVVAHLDQSGSVAALGLLAPNLLRGAQKVGSRLGRARVFARERAGQWSRFLSAVRSTMLESDAIEVTTPSLVVCPGTEPHLDSFFTELTRFGQARGEVFHLPTSPELHLKQALVAGAWQSFEIKTVFRNGEVSGTHQPEFQMLEWYRAFSDLDVLRHDLEKLVAASIAATRGRQPTGDWLHTSWPELYAQHLGHELRPDTSAQELRAWLNQAGLDRGDIRDDEGFADLFHRISIDIIEPRLPFDQPVTVSDFPAQLAILSRLNERGFADRLEMYWRGLEIANGFVELTDPVANRLRMETDLAQRQRLNKPSIKLDLNFLEALEFGCPPAAGIAVGLDRLFMASLGLSDITETRFFPITLT